MIANCIFKLDLQLDGYFCQGFQPHLIVDWLVGWLVGQQDYSKTAKWISAILGWMMVLSPEMDPLSLGADRD